MDRFLTIVVLPTLFWLGAFYLFDTFWRPEYTGLALGRGYRDN